MLNDIAGEFIDGRLGVFRQHQTKQFDIGLIGLLPLIDGRKNATLGSSLATCMRFPIYSDRELDRIG
jgi:hypothetical protein